MILLKNVKLSQAIQWLLSSYKTLNQAILTQREFKA